MDEILLLLLEFFGSCVVDAFQLVVSEAWKNFWRN